LKKIQAAVIADYMRETATRCDAAQARYDAITEHSMNSIPESEAMARAMAEEESAYAQLRAPSSNALAGDSQRRIRRPPTRPRIE
jgi:hypothetical protein